MVTTTFKIAPETLAALRAISCIETLRRGRRVTWAALVRDVIQTHLIVPNAGLTAVTQSR